MKKLPALDGLRGIAILMVFAFHYGAGGVHSSSRVMRILGEICGFGWSGVDLFFVLSGFLITGILYDTRSDPGYYPKFYVRRALRIFPVFYLFAAVLFLVGSHWKLGHLSFLFYVGYPVALIWPGLVNIPLHITHLWSLAVEEQFYFGWPWVIAKVRNPLKACAVAIIAAPILRVIAVLSGHPQWAYTFLFCRVDSLAVGAGIAIMMRYGWNLQRWAAVVFGFVSLSMAGLCLIRHTTDHGDSMLAMAAFSLLAIAYGALLLISLQHERIFSWPVLRVFGKYSYGMYLFHFPFSTLFEPLKHSLSWAYVPTCLALNLGIAALSFHLLEGPILRLKRGFSYDAAVSPCKLHRDLMFAAGVGHECAKQPSEASLPQ